MASRSTDDLHPLLKPKAESFLVRCKEAGINAFMTCTYRSNAEQDKEYAKGRTISSGIDVTPDRPLGRTVTEKRGGESKHNATSNGKPCSEAFDFGILDENKKANWNKKDPRWIKAVEIGKSLGLRSGSSWGDWPHMELKG